MISGIAIGLSVDGGHIGFLPIKELAQGWQSLGTLNMSLHVLTYHMVQKLLFCQFVLGHLTPLTDTCVAIVAMTGQNWSAMGLFFVVELR